MRTGARRIEAGPGEAPQVRVQQRRRQERRQRPFRHPVPVLARRLQMRAGPSRQVGDDRPERRRSSLLLQIRALEAVPGEHRAGQRHPVLTQVAGQRLQQTDQAEGQAEMATGGVGRSLRDPEQVHGAKRDLAPARPEPFLERGQIGRWLGAQLQVARINRGVEARAQRSKARPAGMQRLGHGMGKRLAGSDPVQCIAPPLQAHEPGHGFADDAPHASDLVIECVEDEQRLARIGGREQGREIPVRVMLADLDGGMGEYGGDGSPPRTLSKPTKASRRRSAATPRRW